MAGATCLNKRRTTGVRQFPLQQGALDGLCGVYAIINAVRLLRSLSRDDSIKLFEALMVALGRRRQSLAKVVTGGIAPSTLRHLLRIATDFARRDLGMTLSVKQLSEVGSKYRLSTLWQQLRSHLDAGCVIVLGLKGVHRHWTVACATTQKHIKLFDSDGIKILRRSRCTTGHAVKRHGIVPAELFILTLQ